ncbi:hypothetical protein [Levilactobacillus suantsaiihabitans]|uniref:Uncharacterized protein n=1 Tax=Levilactobacillus suantsaiihabitans TaxID=2487722 RepID=A0A4Z0J6N0_9LACO|nr:hypothetical protein [Levilactobacillus suantsaiihabitans]TGD17561.1 hypothetical protein EGT51_11890 [Levilactobacillus suantsaiihabitans]
MQEISINNVLKGIVDIEVHGEEDELGKNLMESRRKNRIVRDTFLKLINDENFYERSVESGLLKEYSKWLEDTFSIKGPNKLKPKLNRPGSTFLKRPHKWTSEQLIAFIIVAFSSDIYNKELRLDESSEKKISLNNLIMRSMGLGQPRAGINRLNIGSLKRSGLKRFVTDLNGDNAQVVHESSQEITRRGNMLAEFISSEFKYGDTNPKEVSINYRDIKDDVIVDHSGHGLQLYPYHSDPGSIHVLEGMLNAAIDPIAPNDVFEREFKSSKELTNLVLKKVSKVESLIDYSSDASKVVKLGINSRLTAALDELTNAVAILQEEEKRSQGKKI